MNPAVLNNMRLLITIDGHQVWYFERATRQTIRPYLVIAPEGHHGWIGWDTSDYHCQFTRPTITFIRNHATIAYTTL